LEKIDKIVNQLDYHNLYIKIETENDTFILDKQKPRNKIGFEVAKGGE
jgi:hypothetical protein